MSDKWTTNTNGESGILRKNTQFHYNVNTETREELLVFGYACKIFRDDEKALYIDQGKQLIPWMGDNSLKIDRYDVRATLNDLSKYEPPPGGYNNRLDFLSPSELRAEQLCEEERYYSLLNNEVDEEMYQEEELKRLHKMRSLTYGQVGFNYDNDNANSANKSEKSDKTDEAEEPDEPFVSPPNLDIPSDVKLPETMKQHTIIEKTAKFISTQGAQMEILIKTKQSKNPQFEFLNYDCYLFGYYKFILNTIKSGKYIFTDDNNEQDDDFNNDNNNINTNNNINKNAYGLVNSLLYSSTYQSENKIIPQIKYKPSVDCAYTQLVSKITGNPIPKDEPNVDDNETSTSTIIVNNSDVNLTNLYSTYYSKNNITTSQIPSIIKQEVTIDQPNKININNKLIIENDLKLNENFKTNSDGVEIKKISSGLMLAQYYNSDSETDYDDDDNNNTVISNKTNNCKNKDIKEEKISDYPQPPESLKHIIDKTAAYVIKNGDDFENILRTKKDPRFLFLDASNEYYTYYKYQVTGKIIKSTNTNVTTIKLSNSNTDNKKLCNVDEKKIEEINENSKKSVETTSTADDGLESLNKSKILTPVSFSIKAKDEPSIPIKPVLPQEGSSDEEENLNGQQSVQSPVIVNNDVNSVKVDEDCDDTKIIHPEHVVKEGNDKLEVIPPINNLNVEKNHDLITEQQDDDRKEAKRAEEKLKDKLVNAAREKLGLVSKLQLERKKKAMAFLSQIKDSGVALPSSNDLGKDEKVTIIDDNDSDTSVQSIPFTISDKEKYLNEYTTVGKNVIVQIINDNVNSNYNYNNNHIERKRSRSRSKTRSRSRSRSTSHHKRKKSKHHHSKKKSKKKSRSRSKSHSRDNGSKHSGKSSYGNSNRHNSSNSNNNNNSSSK